MVSVMFFLVSVDLLDFMQKVLTSPNVFRRPFQSSFMMGTSVCHPIEFFKSFDPVVRRTKMFDISLLFLVTIPKSKSDVLEHLIIELISLFEKVDFDIVHDAFFKMRANHLPSGYSRNRKRGSFMIHFTL